jgi:hypothetical protein
MNTTRGLLLSGREFVVPVGQLPDRRCDEV